MYHIEVLYNCTDFTQTGTMRPYKHVLAVRMNLWPGSHQHGRVGPVNAVVTDEDSSDSPQFKPLARATAQGWWDRVGFAHK